MNFFDGEILAFDKPYGTTSFKVVYTVRNTLTAKMDGRKIKVGHAGTLDPLATGLLLICTGRATKKIEELQMLQRIAGRLTDGFFQSQNRQLFVAQQSRKMKPSPQTT